MNIQELLSVEQNDLFAKDLSVDPLQREFELDDVYPYIKTGIASIIEDEVTQRFVAEELKVKFRFSPLLTSPSSILVH